METTNRESRRRSARRVVAELNPQAAAISPAEPEVGGRLRQLRRGQGLSLRSLAAMSGLSFNTLSLIENGKSSPSVSTLQRLASALRLPVAAFFDAHGVRSTIVVQRKNNRSGGAIRNGVLEDLCAGSTMQREQVLLVALQPGADSGESPIAHAGHDVIYCLEGHLTYIVDGRTYELTPGDSLVFEGRLPHRWMNDSDRPARSILIMCPADEELRPAEFRNA